MRAPEVLALLAGHKTQHRVPIKPQPDPHLPIAGAECVPPDGVWCWLNGWDGSIIASFSVPCAPGDRLWVREAWASKWPDATMEHIVYCADKPDLPIAWRSSIHMPRWASRLTLIVTNVKAQRVQEISEEDARAEGCAGWAMADYESRTPIGEYRDQWDGRHGPGAWDRNDWVCAITFTVKRGNIDD